MNFLRYMHALVNDFMTLSELFASASTRMSFNVARQQLVYMRLSLPLSLSLPSMRWNLQWSDLVVEEPSHGEPVQRLIASPADAAVVHISGHCHTQPLLAAPEENDNVNLVPRMRNVGSVPSP